MIRSLAVRIWVVVLIGIPLCFFMLPWIMGFFPKTIPWVASACILGCLALIIGTAFDRGGKIWIKGLVREGELWERAGIKSRAEKKYLSAMGVYDSFLLSPWFSAGTGNDLARAMSRFFLNNGSEQPCFQQAADTYIKFNPDDESLAGLWIARLEKQGRVSRGDQDVLTVLADVHFSNLRLVRQLACIFLDLEREDYSGRRLYQTLLDHPELLQGLKAGYKAKMESLMAGEAIGGNNHATYLSMPDPSGPLPSGGFEDMAIQAGRKVYIPREQQAQGKPGVGLKTMGFCLARYAKFCMGLPGWLMAGIREREPLGLYLKYLFAGLAGTGVIFFMVTTISHNLKSKTADMEPLRVEVQMDMPYTIQVAAYLKQSHADRYLAILSKKGVAARIKKTGGGGKIWYLVRISQFPDKASAAAHGNRLKDKKIISEFFVSNK